MSDDNIAVLFIIYIYDIKSTFVVVVMYVKEQ